MHREMKTRFITKNNGCVILIQKVLFKKKTVSLSKKCKAYIFKVMMFNEQIKQLREDCQIPQRK